jgi:hypothetical protein
MLIENEREEKRSTFLFLKISKVRAASLWSINPSTRVGPQTADLNLKRLFFSTGKTDSQIFCNVSSLNINLPNSGIKNFHFFELYIECQGWGRQRGRGNGAMAPPRCPVWPRIGTGAGRGHKVYGPVDAPFLTFVEKMEICLIFSSDFPKKWF